MATDVKLKSGQTQTLSDKEMKMRDINLQNQGITDTGTPGETGGTVVRDSSLNPNPDSGKSGITQEDLLTFGKPKDTLAPSVERKERPENISRRDYIDTERDRIRTGKGLGADEDRSHGARMKRLKAFNQSLAPDTPENKNIIKTPEPVQQVQEVKNQALINEQDEIVVQEQKRTQATTEFERKLQSGASIQELANFTSQNPGFESNFNDVARNYFKTNDNAKFYNKYNGISNESMYSAVKNGAIKIGSERYNMLSEAQRQSFEQFKAVKDAPAGIPTTKEEVFNPNTPENSVDFSNIEQFANKMFSSDLRKKMDEMRNDDRVVNLSQELNAKASELEKFDIDGIKENTKLEKELGNAGYTPAYIRAKLRDNTANRAIERMGMVSEYNRVQGDLQSIKDDIETDIKMFEYEDQQARDKYSFLFSVYESRRGEQRAEESALAERQFTREMTAEEREYQTQRDEFLEINKQLATQRQQDFQMQMKQIDQEFALKNQKPSYEIGRDGKMYAILDGKATVVKSDMGEVLFGEETNNHIKSIYDNNDGTFTEVTTFKDNRPVSIATYDAQGNKVTGTPDSVMSIIEQCRVTGQCGAGVNDYLQNLGLGRLMGNSYESKAKNINSATPTVGGVAIWNPQQGQGKFKEYGHTGIVTGVNEEKGTVTITDWNWNGDEKQQTREVKMSEITYNGGFMNFTQEEAPSYDENKAPLYAKFNAGKMSQTQELKYADDEEFLNSALAYGEEKAKPGYDKINDLIGLAESLKGMGPIDRQLPDNKVDVDKILGRAGMNELIDLKGQGATFGSLTEGEFERIQSSVLNVGPITSEGKWNNILDDYINTLKRGLPEDFEITGGIYADRQENNMTQTGTTGTLLTDFESQFNINEYDNILNR